MQQIHWGDTYFCCLRTDVPSSEPARIWFAQQISFSRYVDFQHLVLSVIQAIALGTIEPEYLGLCHQLSSTNYSLVAYYALTRF